MKNWALARIKAGSYEYKSYAVTIKPPEPLGIGAENITELALKSIL